jgi:hypothetical protein
MPDVLDWSPPWTKVLDQLDAPRSIGAPVPMRRVNHKRVVSHAPADRCIVRPPALPGLELAIPGDVAAGIEALVEHSLDTTVAGMEHGLLDLPTPDRLNVDTVFGPSYSGLVKTGLDGATARGIARWGGAVFFISNRLAEAREQLDWHTDRMRAAERRKAKDAVDMRLASRLVGQWGGTEGAQSLRDQVHTRGSEPPKPDRCALNARLAVATLEGRLNYLLATGGVSARAAVGLAALLDARGWGELSVLVACSGLVLSAHPKIDPEARAKTWLDGLAHDAIPVFMRCRRRSSPAMRGREPPMRPTGHAYPRSM